jgi:four helix bundle suffix protein
MGGMGQMYWFRRSMRMSCFARLLSDLLKSRPPEVCANIMICLVNQCNFLLDRQIEYLEENFTKEGGLRERMYNARNQYKKDKNG